MNLNSNLFTNVPTVKNAGNLYLLKMNDNPIENMINITLYTSLQYLYLTNTNISTISHTIDKLQKLVELCMNNNKLFFLPTNLTFLEVQNNLISSRDKEEIRKRFNQFKPNVILYI